MCVSPNGTLGYVEAYINTGESFNHSHHLSGGSNMATTATYTPTYTSHVALITVTNHMYMYLINTVTNSHSCTITF